MSQGQPPPAYPAQGYPQGGYPQGGYPQGGYPQGGYPQPGYPQPGYPQPGYPQGGGYSQGGYPQGQPQGGYNGQGGYPQTNASQAPPPPSNEEGDDAFAGSSFSSKAIRNNFIKKVYSIICVQLLVTMGIICLFIFPEKVRCWIQDNSWSYYISYAVFIITYIALVCCPSVRRKFPGNFICLAVFTLALSYMTATISSFYNTTSVLIAFGITFGVCVAISLFAWQTKFDFTKCCGLLFVLLIVLILFGIACAIVAGIGKYENGQRCTVVKDPVSKICNDVCIARKFHFANGTTCEEAFKDVKFCFDTTSNILFCVYGGLGALVFALFLAYDTQQLIGGRKHQISEEEYIYGALQIYLDVVYMFQFILMLVGLGGGGD